MWRIVAIRLRRVVWLWLGGVVMGGTPPECPRPCVQKTVLHLVMQKGYQRVTWRGHPFTGFSTSARVFLFLHIKAPMHALCGMGRSPSIAS